MVSTTCFCLFICSSKPSLIFFQHGIELLVDDRRNLPAQLRLDVGEHFTGQFLPELLAFVATVEHLDDLGQEDDHQFQQWVDHGGGDSQYG